MKPEISIIMSVYNGEKFLKSCIESILNQTFEDFEFIIINDGSTDKSEEIIKSFKDKRIILINQNNVGLTKSLNKGLYLARGDFIARMDCDDIAKKERLETQLNFLKRNKDIILVGSWVDVINQNNKIIGEYRYPFRFKEIKKVMFRYNPFVHPTLMFRRKLIQKVGYYNEKKKYAQDYDLLMRTIRKFKIVNIPKSLLLFRRFDGCASYSKMKKQELSALKTRIEAIKNGTFPIYYIIFLIKPIISFLMPVWIKRILINKFIFNKKR